MAIFPRTRKMRDLGKGWSYTGSSLYNRYVRNLKKSMEEACRRTLKLKEASLLSKMASAVFIIMLAKVVSLTCVCNSRTQLKERA